MAYIAKLAHRLARLRAFDSAHLSSMVSLLLITACAAGEPTGISTVSLPDLPDAPVVVSPRRMTLEGTQQVLFRAYESDLTTQVTSIEWTTTGGSIGADGSYSSSTTGDFRVVGKRKGNPHNAPDTSVVTVVPQQSTLASVVVSPSAATVVGGQYQQYSASGLMSDGSTVAIGVTWSATGGTIDAGGLFMAGNSGGTFQVIATHVTTGIADTVPVTVQAVQSIALTPTSTSLPTGGTQQYAATGTLADGSKVSLATVGYSVTGGTISTKGLYTAPLTAGSYTAKAQVAPGTGTGPSASAAISVLAATSTTSGGSAGYPHEPAGVTPFFESRFTVPVSASTGPVTDLTGYEFVSAAQWPATVVVAETTGPKSPGSVLQFTYPTGMDVGSGPPLMQAWNTASSNNNAQYREIYVSHWTKIPEATFQQNAVGTKLFGFIGYGEQGTNVPNQMILGVTGGGPMGTLKDVSSMPIVFTQQNNVGRSIPMNVNTGHWFVVGRWNRLEIHMKLNTVVNGNDGLLEVWLDNGDGQGLVKILSYANVTYTTDAAHSKNGNDAQSGFYGYRWDPVFGGNDPSAGGRTKVNHLLVDHLYISGILK